LIAVDTNLLVYALREDSPWHDSARGHLVDLAEAGSPWAIPAPCLHEFLAIATHPRIYLPPTPSSVAIDFVQALFESPTLQILSETDGYWDIFIALMSSAKIVGPKVHDGRIAALCLHHRVAELWSADRDFGRFPELKTRNPLVSKKPKS
jgi:toxin-antitoxin system PIN domain toxin